MPASAGSDRTEGQAGYWREKLSGAPSEIGLPRHHAPVGERRHRAGMVAFTVDEEVRRGLEELARTGGASMFAVLLSVLGLLLWRYSGQVDLVVGGSIADGGRRELPLRLDLSGDPSFEALLGRVRDVCLEAREHQDAPFERLFQVLFAYRGTPQPGPELDSGASGYVLSLSMSERDGMLRGRLEYDSDLLEATTVERMAGHYGRLLACVVERPECGTGELPLLSEEERSQLLQGWNRTARPYPPELTLPDLFEAQVGRSPGACAVRCAERELSYAELDARANLLARRLRDLGVGPEVLVGICLERSPEMVVALLGVLKAGGAYLPLDPEYPRERLASMLQDSRAPVLISQSGLLDRLPTGGVHVELLDAGPAGDEVEAPERQLSPDNLAYVIYTSGSTGRPKGVMNSHRGVCNRLLWMREELGLDADEPVLQKTPFSFDVAVWEFFLPLLAGAPMVLARPGGHRDSGYLAGLLREQRVRMVHFVPSMLEGFLQEPELGELPELRALVCSGEVLGAALARRFRARLGKCGTELYNLYGPTEAAVDVSWHRWTGEGDRATVPIGSPVANTELYVVDAGLEPVPVGVTGELLIGGVQVARGYLGRPGLTAERFLPDPFAPRPGARVYRTGDLVRRLAGGDIEFLGRLDHQVKIRGYRIELGEVDAHVRAVPGVADCLVTTHEDEEGHRRLAAYFVPAHAGMTSRRLREELRRTLPAHLVPSVVVPVDAWPLTPNGKVDRAALSALRRGRGGSPQ